MRRSGISLKLPEYISPKADFLKKFNMIFEDIGQDSRMQKAKEFIHLNYDKKITIDDMAKNAYISK